MYSIEEFLIGGFSLVDSVHWPLTSLRRRRREKQLQDIGAEILASSDLLGKVSFEIDIPKILFPRMSSSGSFEFRVSVVEGEKIL